MIKSLRIQGVKGLDTALNLTAKTAVVGPNFSGKTAVSDAIQMALIGYVPRLGKKNSATFQLASATEMTVEAMLEDGAAFRRTWSLKKGSVKLEESEPFTWPAQLLDISLFLNASAKEKLAMVSASAGSSDEIGQLVKEKTGLDGINSLAQIEKALEACAEEAKMLKAQIKTYEGTLTGTAAIDADTAAATYDEAGHLKILADIEKTQNELVAALDASKHIMTRNEAADAAADELETFPAGDVDELEAEIATMTKQMAAQNERAAEIRGKLSSLESALDLPIAVRTATAQALKPYLTMDTAQMKLLRAEYAAKLGEDYDDAQMVSMLETLNERQTATTTKLSDAKRDRTLIDGQIIDLTKELNKLKAEPHCPMCFAGDDGWRENAETYYTHKIDDLREKFAERVADIESLTKEANEISNQWAGIEAKRQMWVQMEKLREALENMEKHEQATARIAEVESQKLDLTTELRNITSTPYVAMIEAKRRQIDMLKKASILRNAVNNRPSDKEYSDAVNLVEGLRASLVEMKARVNTYEIAKADWIRESERARTQQESRQRLDALKTQLDDQLAQIAGLNACVPVASQSIWKAVNAAAANFGDVLSECTLSVKDGEIGAWHGASWVTFEALSGTEQLAAAAALQAGLASTAPFRLLVLDELSRMTNETKTAFCDALNGMVERGAVDQVIVIDHDEAFWKARADWSIFDTMAE